MADSITVISDREYAGIASNTVLNKYIQCPERFFGYRKIGGPMDCNLFADKITKNVYGFL